MIEKIVAFVAKSEPSNTSEFHKKREETDLPKNVKSPRRQRISPEVLKRF